MSRVLRPTIALGAAAILSLGLSACSKQKSGSPHPSQGTPAPASSAAAPPASASAATHPQTHIGECFQFGPNEDSAVTSVDCNQPHDGEYFHIFDFAGTSLPSDDEMDEESDEICGLIFEHYVGTSPEETTLDYTAMSPTKQTWAKGDREIVCIAVRTDDEQLTASVRDSGL